MVIQFHAFLVLQWRLILFRMLFLHLFALKSTEENCICGGNGLESKLLFGWGQKGAEKSAHSSNLYGGQVFFFPTQFPVPFLIIQTGSGSKPKHIQKYSHTLVI